MLGAFFFDWRTALIGAVAIPLSLVAAALVLYLRGTTFNTVILAGLVVALGAIVDDVVIDVDAIKRRLREQPAERQRASAAEVILEAVLETRGPARLCDADRPAGAGARLLRWLYRGLPGAFFAPLALSYALALLASMVVALTVTPALALFLSQCVA